MLDVEAEQAFATECIVREAREEGMQQGRINERIEIFERLVKERILTKQETEKQLSNL